MRMFALILCLAIVGCAPRPVIEIHTPPDFLLAECPAPVFDGHTNGDLITHILGLRDSLSRCNADKAALRAWSKGIEEKAYDR